ncbi:DUF4349 domain-containing protein [Ignavibacteria bacterium]|nr:DUF4349 domain-containing protein [Bacteroidota bacterium]MCZ2132598.1 DUF4349 domain-containing protein [Bacteroidota bacterium]
MRSRIFSVALVVSAFIAVYGCDDKSEIVDGQFIKTEAISPSDAKIGGEATANDKSLSPVVDKTFPQSRKLIYTANLHLRVENVEAAGKIIRAAVTRSGGYIAHEEYERNVYSQQVSAIFRVPAEKFDATLKEISAVALTVESRNVKTDDVTAEFIDVSARLAAKKDVEMRYRELLKQAKSISEILEIEEKIGTIRSEIESSQGRLNYLYNQEQYSAIEVMWYETSTVALPENSFGARFVRGIVNGWNGAISVLIGLVNTWPFLLILAIGVYFLRRIIRRSRKPSAERSAEKQP